MSFTIFYNEKNPFLGYKNKNLKKSKIRYFSKRVNPWFWSKNGHISNYFFWYYRLEMVFYDILERKKAFQGYKKKISTSRKIDIFSKWVNPCLWSKNGQFSNFFFLRIIGQENVFYDIPERKNPFLGYKNKKFKKSKN